MSTETNAEIQARHDRELIAELSSYLLEHGSDVFKNDSEITISINDLAKLLDIAERKQPLEAK